MNERLSWSEAEAVVRSYRAEYGMSSHVDVATLAQTLGTSPAEVRRLAGLKRRFIDRSGVLSALLSIGVLAVAALTIERSPFVKNPSTAATSRLHTVPPIRRTNVLIVTDGDGRTRTLDFDGEPDPSDNWSYPTEERATLLFPDEKTL